MSPEEWYRSLPPVTKVYWSVAVLTTLLTAIGVLNPYYILMHFDLVIGKFQIWRLLTNFFFFGGFSMSFVFSVVLLVRYTGMLEEKFGRDVQGTAAMLTCLLFCMTVILAASYLLVPNAKFYSHCLLFCIVYVWSRSDPFAEVQFYGFSFRQWHTPFLLLVAGMLYGEDPVLALLGIATGHLYYFVTDMVPRNWGRTLIWTPTWMVDGVKFAQAKWAGVPVPVNSAAPRPNWQQGQGHRLG